MSTELSDTFELPPSAVSTHLVPVAMDNARVQTPFLRIRPPSGWAALDLREVWQYRELLWFFSLRDIKSRYKQTLLGPIWIVLMPLISSGIFSLIFGVLAGMPSGDIPYPVFVFSGMLVWGLFAKALSASSVCLRANQNLITKVYFPRLIIPMAASIGGVIDFLLGGCLLAVLMCITGVAPGWAFFTFPAFALLAMVTGMALGLWISALSVRFRDLGYAVGFISTIWMWVTPVAYSSDVVIGNKNIPEHIRPLLEVTYQLNPMHTVVQGFRWSILNHHASSPSLLGLISVVIVMFLLITGMYMFRRAEATFADII